MCINEDILLNKKERKIIKYGYFLPTAFVYHKGK